MSITRKQVWGSAMIFFLLVAILSLLAGQASADSYQLGEIITFGTYEQNNNSWDGPEEIEWIVLDQKDGQIMLISKYCIDSQPYNSTLEPITWEYSSLREWLNGIFFDTAFSQEEQDRICAVENENPDLSATSADSGRATMDRIFILSKEEAKLLFHSYSARKAAPTAYAMAEGAHQNPNNHMGWWWLRTSGNSAKRVCYVTTGGDIGSDSRDVTRWDAGVRPVMWISAEETLESQDTTVQNSQEQAAGDFSAPVPSEPTSPAAVSIQFDFVNNAGSDYAYIFGEDADGQLLWFYKSDIYPNSTQLPKVSEIQQHGDRYYFCEDGQIVALESSTGKVLWRNCDFNGNYPIGDVDDNGILYLSGYEGPDFLAIDSDGNTMCRIDKLDPDFYWPVKIQSLGRYIELSFASNTEKQFYINSADYTYKCIG